MLTCMKDSAHDCLHIYRVLYQAIEISRYEQNVDEDVLIAACLLHDIGRAHQFNNPTVCHAEHGARMAYEHLIMNGWSKEQALHVESCISSHRFRGNNIPQSIEAKILFDSDKLDATGALGIARCLIYEGLISEPIYTLDDSGRINDELEHSEPSFIREYNGKLKVVYNNFYTLKATEIAAQRKAAAEDFYKNLLNEASWAHTVGMERLANLLTGK